MLLILIDKSTALMNENNNNNNKTLGQSFILFCFGEVYHIGDSQYAFENA